MKRLSAFVSIAIVLLAAAAPLAAQSMDETIKKQFGKDAKVTAVTMRYDFSGLAREITMPFESFPFMSGEQPAGYKESSTVKPATAPAKKLWASWEKELPSFGAPSQKIIQAYSGKEGGVIMYFRWNAPLPADARRQICRVLYGKDEKPIGSDTQDDLFVTNDWCMIWSFAKPLSELKQAHQKRTFEIVNQEAQRWMDANPEKAKKYLQPKKP
ncbi:MAG: hypothetical protein FGM33_10030 [Candidatus Kapabacteria bacterium]|nr:hypothetical protein [Candidatus Kapabacteria bacterium]